MWRMTGFWLWKKKLKHGEVTFIELSLKDKYELFASGRSHGKTNPYAEERVDMNEFRKG